MFLPPTRVICAATSVYKCDKGLFAREFCVLKCVQKCVHGVPARSSAAKALEDSGAWRSHNPKPLQDASFLLRQEHYGGRGRLVVPGRTDRAKQKRVKKG